MKVIVSNIRHVESSDDYPHYVADVIVDGVSRSFQFRIGYPFYFSMTTERAFDDLLYPTYATKEICRLIGHFNKGERIDFPVDLGEF